MQKEKTLIVDDNLDVSFLLDEFRPFFEGPNKQIEHILFGDPSHMTGQMAIKEAELFAKQFSKNPKIAYSRVLGQEGVVNYLKSNHQNYNRIVFDGLKFKCIEIIKEAGLIGDDKVAVYSWQSGIVNRCRALGINAEDKSSWH